MPTREPVASTLTDLPNNLSKPLPVRVVSTRSGPAKKPATPAAAAPNGNQPTTVETGSDPAAASATTEESVRLSPAASALARKEQAFRQREQAFKAREAEVAAFKDKAEKFERLQKAVSAKDYSVLDELGVEYDGYTKYKVERANGEDPVAQEMASLRAEIAELKKGQEESVNRDYDAVVSDYRNQISALVDSNADFSSIKHLGKEGVEAVLQLITDSWNEDDIELTAEQACKDIEAELFATAQKFSALPKLKPATPSEDATPQATPRPSVNTLTNNMQPPAGAPEFKKSLQHMPDDQRYAEARRRVLARRAAQQQG